MTTRPTLFIGGSKHGRTIDVDRHISTVKIPELAKVMWPLGSDDTIATNTMVTTTYTRKRYGIRNLGVASIFVLAGITDDKAEKLFTEYLLREFVSRNLDDQ